MDRVSSSCWKSSVKLAAIFIMALLFYNVVMSRLDNRHVQSQSTGTIHGNTRHAKSRRKPLLLPQMDVQDASFGSTYPRNMSVADRIREERKLAEEITQRRKANALRTSPDTATNRQTEKAGKSPNIATRRQTEKAGKSPNIATRRETEKAGKSPNIATRPETENTGPSPNTARRQRLNNSQLNATLYHMAKPVFDALPEKYLPGYKNPCWMLASNRSHRQLRCLPYFYLLGMAKCGTSELWGQLANHPDVYADVQKEVHWWTRLRFPTKMSEGESFEWYLNDRSEGFVEYLQEYPNLRNTLVIGDGSASTLWDNRVWQRTFGAPREGPDFVTADIIRAVQPNAKLIVILREPTSRLYSDYKFLNRVSAAKRVSSPKDFDMQVRATKVKFEECTRTMSRRACTYAMSGAHQRLRLLLGLYSIFIKDWLKVYPREQLLVVRLEDWMSNCTEVLPQIYTFLELAPLPDERIAKFCQKADRNSRGKDETSSRRVIVPDMWESTRELLQEFYSEPNRELSRVLGDDRFLWQ